ncbi:MAG: DUF2752 domain-containing protein [Burkholderiales bacterium]|nr:DUF2752 domain-containing protein [Phycisphaerae bacterium]
MAILIIAISVLAVGYLYFHNPAEHHLFPTCLFHYFTGLQCPGCGGTRAAYALLHGRLGLAIWYNPLAVLVAPIALLWGVDRVRRVWRGDVVSNCFTHIPPRVVWGLAIFLTAFWIGRNLPGYPLGP